LVDLCRYCDIVTTTTHKSLRGPRSGIIFYRKGPKRDINDNVIEGQTYDFEASVNFAVFPSIQGGPHENQIAAVAVAMKEVQDESFKDYVKQLKSNAKALAEGLKEHVCLCSIPL
jgi:glycine hydroxymethyltransferase